MEELFFGQSKLVENAPTGRDGEVGRKRAFSPKVLQQLELVQPKLPKELCDQVLRGDLGLRFGEIRESESVFSDI